LLVRICLRATRRGDGEGRKSQKGDWPGFGQAIGCKDFLRENLSVNILRANLVGTGDLGVVE
jgi:hypothetical protein